jgi:TonB family protein
VQTSSSARLLVLSVLTAALPLTAVAQVSPSGIISGRLISIAGTPAAGVRVAAVAASEANGRRDASSLLSFAQTDSDGRYRLENVPAGSYYIMAGSLQAPSYYPGNSKLSEATIVTLTTSSPVNVSDFRFVPPNGVVQIERTASVPGRFYGVITDGERIPLPLATVLLTNSRTGMRFITCTDRSGAFEFQGLPAGEFSMETRPAVRTGYYGGPQMIRSPDLGGHESFTGSVTIRADESLREEIRLRLFAPLDTSWQLRPDLYARFERTLPAAYAAGQLRNIRPPTLAYPPGVPGAKSGDSVALQLIIRDDGSLASLQVVSPDANADLARAALQELAGWTFQPDVRYSVGTITVTFTTPN